MKHIPFLSIPHLQYDRLTEYYYKQIAHYANTVFVAQNELSKQVDFRMFGSYPAPCSKKTEEQKKKHAGWPKFVFGQYYDLGFLLYMEDVFEYSHSYIKFEQIRTAKDINKLLLEGQSL
jgi:hypothetical protein